MPAASASRTHDLHALNPADELTTSGARSFPCVNCGAPLEFSPGTGRLSCAACGTVNDTPVTSVSAVAETHEELDYVTWLMRGREAAERERVASGAPRARAVTCSQCGAATQFDPHVVASVCAFCASPLVAERAEERDAIRPRGVVPFAVPVEEAQTRFVQWIASRWFAPNALKETVRKAQGIRGVYIPAWTFDAATVSRYVGQRGVYRQVEERRRNAQGHMETVTRTVTDWTPATGSVSATFDDKLVPASGSLPSRLRGVLGNWGVQGLLPYADDYVAGFTVELYQVGLEDAFAEAQRAFDSAIESRVRSDIGGNTQRVHRIDTQYSNITFKHVLLPIWIASYRFRDTVYQVVVNGQSGVIDGDRPWSPWKVAFATIAVVVVIGALVLLADARG
jgi:hypothetical protein